MINQKAAALNAATSPFLSSRWAQLVLGLALALPLPGHSDCPPPPTPPDPQQASAAMRSGPDHGFLWKITKNGHSSYLYGTLHAAQKEWMFPGKKVTAALLGADVLAVELDMLDASVQQQLQTGLGDQGDVALPPTLDRRLRDLAAGECLPDSINQMAPQLRSMTLGMVAGRRDGIEPAYAIDLVLTQIGYATRKKVVSLETPQQQMEALRAATAQETIEQIEQEVQQLEQGKTRALLARIARAWRSSDKPALENYPAWCECLRNDAERAAMRRMLDDRNLVMAEKIDRLHQAGGRVFVAVGSLHMMGKLGLPALLAQRQYQVEYVDLRAQPNH